METGQTVVTIAIVGGALIYAIRRLYRAVKCDRDACEGCELKKNCQKFGRYK